MYQSKALVYLLCEAGKNGGPCRRKKIQPGELYAFIPAKDHRAGLVSRWHLACAPASDQIHGLPLHVTNAPGGKVHGN